MPEPQDPKRGQEIQRGEEWPLLPDSVPRAEAKAGLEQMACSSLRVLLPTLVLLQWYDTDAGYSWAPLRAVRDLLLYPPRQ